MSADEWVLVPREPTFDMLRAVENERDILGECEECGEADVFLDNESARELWKAMLKAAPKPPVKAQS